MGVGSGLVLRCRFLIIHAQIQFGKKRKDALDLLWYWRSDRQVATDWVETVFISGVGQPKIF